ncbi:MAG TPA: hypothetical protein PK954_04900, partial [Anaerolineales bacterium]|nr:hypothetical protein [Anaerolineales bacterium]
ILSEGMLGFVVMVDSTRPETFREAISILQTFKAYAPTPYVVAANKQDSADAWDLDDLRIALRLDPAIKLLPCVARDRESVKGVLLELLYAILEEMAPDTSVDVSALIGKAWSDSRCRGAAETLHAPRCTLHAHELPPHRPRPRPLPGAWPRRPGVADPRLVGLVGPLAADHARARRAEPLLRRGSVRIR